jgi:hypothetical protein
MSDCSIDHSLQYCDSFEETYDFTSGNRRSTLTVKYELSISAPSNFDSGLKVTVTNSKNIPSKVFIFADAQDKSLVKDEFVCVADTVDLFDVPEDQPTPGASRTWFRKDNVTLFFRNETTRSSTISHMRREFATLIKNFLHLTNVCNYKPATTSYLPPGSCGE